MSSRQLSFVDADDVEGRIDSDLALEYDGRYDIIRTYIVQAENGSCFPENSVQELMLDLYEGCPIREIELVEAD